jgi:hypothetical protein
MKIPEFKRSRIGLIAEFHKISNGFPNQDFFELSNLVNGQKFKKLLTLNEAQVNLWAIYGPIAVKLLTACKQQHTTLHQQQQAMMQQMALLSTNAATLHNNQYIQ